MDDETESSEKDELISRAPEKADIVKLCRELNRNGAEYLIIGGFAIIQAGYPRTTGDIDILLETSPANEAKVYLALESLPDRAVRELRAGDVSQYTVVRVADEITVDLMASACGIDYAAAKDHINFQEIDGVSIPFASPELLWRMKRHTRRDKDAPDLAFLRQWFEANGRSVPKD